MTKYHVTYEIEVDSPDPKSAALFVEKIIKEPYFRPFFTVKNEDTWQVDEIDLDADE